MQKPRWFAALLAASACALLAACSPSEPEPSAPPPPPPAQAPPPPLAGGSPPPPASYPPAPYDGSQVVTMNPIPNPEDLSPTDRARIYGPGAAGAADRGAIEIPGDQGAQGPVYAEPERHPRRRHVQYVVRTVHGRRVVKRVHSLRAHGPQAQGPHPALTLPARHAPHHAPAASTAPAKPVVKAAPAHTAPAGQAPSGPPSSSQPAAPAVAAPATSIPAPSPAPDASAGLRLPSLAHFMAKLTGQSDQAPIQASDQASSQGSDESSARSDQAGGAGVATPPANASGMPGLNLSRRAQMAIMLALLAVLILALIRRNITAQHRAAQKRKAQRPLDLDNQPPSGPDAA
ncbi:MAG TPA: hypothetical protein VMU59_01250 [Caulobacteraceae bacterium]|nr:hypothetical protein [Caulobacteraceae bacterium]